jgi:hypothetical protein
MRGGVVGIRVAYHIALRVRVVTFFFLLTPSCAVVAGEKKTCSVAIWRTKILGNENEYY